MDSQDESTTETSATSKEAGQDLVIASMDNLNLDDDKPNSGTPVSTKSDNVERIVESVLTRVVTDVGNQEGEPVSTTDADVPTPDTENSTLEAEISTPDAHMEDKPAHTPFSFERKFLAPTRKVPLYCRLCTDDGHRDTECDSMGMGPVPPLKQLPAYFVKLLSNVCTKIFQDNKLTEQEKKSRSEVLSEVERYLKKFLNRTLDFF